MSKNSLSSAIIWNDGTSQVLTFKYTIIIVFIAYIQSFNEC